MGGAVGSRHTVKVLLISPAAQRTTIGVICLFVGCDFTSLAIFVARAGIALLFIIITLVLSVVNDIDDWCTTPSWRMIGSSYSSNWPTRHGQL